jgi:hypothetical protein
MILAVMLVVFAALALVFILGLTVSRGLQLSEGSGLATSIQPVDIEAFRNLVNPAEDDHLRRRLPSAEFRHVRRARLRAAAAYVQVAGRNAAILVRIGQSAQSSDDRNTVEAATRLVDQSLRLRQNAAVALFRIYIALAWPNSGLAATPVLDGYRELSGAAMLLGRLQNPAEPVRIAAS